MKKRQAALLLFACSFATAAQAQITRYTFEGTVTYLESAPSGIWTSVQLGDSFSLTFRVNSAATAMALSSGEFFYPGAVVSAEVTVAGVTDSIAPTSFSGATVLNDVMQQNGGSGALICNDHFDLEGSSQEGPNTRNLSASLHKGEVPPACSSALVDGQLPLALAPADFSARSVAVSFMPSGFLNGQITSITIDGPLLPQWCNGDGGNQAGCTSCPCMNDAPLGTTGGCLNSAATSAHLIGSGNPSVSLPPGDVTDLRFSMVGAPPSAFCVLTSGDSVAPTNAVNACFGLNSGVQSLAFDGLRCAAMNTRRHGGRVARVDGAVGFTSNPWGGEGGPPVGIAVAGSGFAAGQTRFFQVIHRDDPLASCMRGLNTSQAVEVTFTP